jgi:glutathione S-transferase
MLKKPQERDRKIMDAAVKALVERLQYLETEIGDKPYIVGDISLVDVAIVPRFLRLAQWGVMPSPALAKLSAWLQRMMARPSVKPFV